MGTLLHFERCKFLLDRCVWLNLATRPFKYDDTQLEYFIETSERVRIKKSDLEKVRHLEELDPQACFCFRDAKIR